MRAILLLSILILATIATFFRFNVNGQKLPIGCDEFGYLQMAQNITEGELFQEHTKRDFLKGLITHLKEEGYEYQEYAWAIAPHAYHVDQGTSKIINQYPPGTSVLLSCLPWDWRQEYFAALMMLLLIGLPLIGILLTISERSSFLISTVSLLIAGVFFITSSPMLLEFGRVNSVAPTFGILLLAGIFLEKRPGLAVFLVSLTCVFRLANVLLIFPLLPFLILENQALNVKESRVYFLRSLRYGAIFIFSGFGLYLIYAWALLGNPFAPTYSDIDQRSIGPEFILENIAYYFSEHIGWLVVTVISMSLLVALKIKGKISLNLFISLLFMPLFIYGFFIFHFIKTPYYPYAPSLIILGFLIVKLSEIVTLGKKAALSLMFVPIIAFASIAVLHGMKMANSNSMPLNEQRAIYLNTFNKTDVLWGDLRSSTYEYSTEKPGMRFNWGSQELVNDVVDYLNKKGMSQAIILEDLDEERRNAASALLTKYSNSNIINSDDFGEILIVPGAKK